MEQKSMTALVSAFSRGYHAQQNEVKIFDDSLANRLLTEEGRTQVSKSMGEGIGFFNPTFVGTPDEALRWVVDYQLSPAPLGRSAFSEKALQTAAAIGARQYLILGAGYDTFAYRQPKWAERLRIFELDHPATAADKQARIKAAAVAVPENVQYVAADFLTKNWRESLMQNTAFSPQKISFCGILGVVYYLPKETFAELLSAISSLVPKGSSIVFDYPDQDSYTDRAGERAKKQAMLAGAANEKMLARYSYEEIEQLLAAHGFLIYEHLTPEKMTEQYFAAYNQANPEHSMTAFEQVNYCLAVKR